MYRKLLIPCLLCLFACSSQRVDPPEISLRNIAITNVELFQTTLASTIMIDNPSPEPLNLTGAVHRLYINGKNIGKANSSEAMTIPAFSQSEQQVNFKLDNLTMYSNVKGLIELSSFSYRIDSKLYTTDSNWPIKVESEHRYGY